MIIIIIIAVDGTKAAIGLNIKFYSALPYNNIIIYYISSALHASVADEYSGFVLKDTSY